MKTVKQEKVFRHHGGEHPRSAAERWLKARGFSFGPSEVGSPRAVWFGEREIPKWGYLTRQEMQKVHALLTDTAGEPARILLMPDAPEEARTAFLLTDEDLSARATQDSATGAQPQGDSE